MKRTIVSITAVLAIAIFMGGVFFYQNANDPQAPVVAEGEQSEDGLVRPYSPVLGQIDAPVTIVEFLDPSCEACRAFFPHVEEILKNHPNDVRVVVRYAAFHDGSDEAVRILEASRKQYLFEPVLEALFSQQPQWAIHGSPDLNRAWDIAAAQGVDIDRAKADAKRSEIDNILMQDKADIQTNNVRQTPTFFINGKQLMSVEPEQLRRLVTAEVQKSKGIQPAQVDPAIRKIASNQICMVDNTFLGREQMPVPIDGKIYYGCSPGSVQKLQMDASLRSAIDPVSGKNVDKSEAVLGVAEDGRVYYFENDENMKQFDDIQR